MLSGTRASIAIKIFGTDLVEMQRIGKQVKASIDGIEGLVDLAVEPLTQVPQIQIRANRAALAEYGIGAEAFNRFIALAFQGEKLAEI